MKITPRKLIKYFITFLITKYFHLLLVSTAVQNKLKIAFGSMKKQ